mmetsp:Transcript_19266/g.60603  ORF Transcript_19266/g.60603 Transcript_19266/m.60603 type:complete len:101 (-) Transcript_19266:486-788(-)
MSSKALRESQRVAHELWKELETTKERLARTVEEKKRLERRLERAGRVLQESLKLLEIETATKRQLAANLRNEAPELARAQATNRQLATALLALAARCDAA